MGLTPSPTEAWPLAWIALVPLWFIVVRGQSIRGNALSGLIWGIGYHGLALSWITGIHPMDWMGVPWLASIAIALLCWILITLWGALLVAVWAIAISITQSITASFAPLAPQRAIPRWGVLELKSPRIGGFRGLAAKGNEVNSSENRCKFPSTKATQQRNINPDINPDINLPTPTQNYVLLTSCLRVLIGTGLWCGIETLWSMSPLYWSGLSYTQSPHNLIILHLGQLSGPITVTAAIVAVNGLIAESGLTLNHLFAFAQRRLCRKRGLLAKVGRFNVGRFNVGRFKVGSFKVESDHNKLEPSTSQKLEPSTPQNLKPSTPQNLEPSTPQNLQHSTPQNLQHSTLLGIAIGLLISLHLLGWLLYNQPIEQSKKSAIKVGIIQGNIPNEIKLYSAGWRRAIKGYTTGYQTLADQKVDAVLTPETALPFLWQEQVRTVSSFYSAILDKGVLVWVGGYGQRGRSLTNSLFTVTGTGETFSRYDKVKLVPLGEYIPFEEFLGRLIDRLSPLDSHLAAGKPDQLVETPFGQAVVGICYESAFAEHFRYQAASGGQFIITASNNAHYSNTMPAQHHAQDVMRSIETDRWTVRATNTGYSGIVDPHGKTIWLSGINTYELHADTIYRRQTQTLYVQWGNWLTPVLLGLGGIGWLILGWCRVGVGLE
ncbi:apolipoprotein N-acyltransferase [Moorena producens PAL-8-15-08-1]|uniref:Apolipoprotein N-acyltransferase n=1 Tax=Moorena producens PAL-8-15-08-1 TaxID=1458985 RepID=A0A1D8TP48_9CYAN|nr:apolipoprotein N-acyltransferase [Moorena producens]AOW99374.1 apolipoprotein N-acyltransferase [Moorena producens PAL-8-15-08-1]